MDAVKRIFQRKKVVIQKLSSYGFSKNGDTYFYRANLPSSGFEMQVCIQAQGDISTTLLDTGSNEPYTLHLVESAAGSFVGAIKSEYETVLQDIADRCFEPDVFKCAQTKALIEYVRSKYGDEPEYLWKKFPDNAVWRR